MIQNLLVFMCLINPLFAATPSDISLRNKIMPYLFPGETRLLGAAQLENAELYARILEKYGMGVTDVALLKEQQRIEQNTKLPENLRRIKAAFQGDDGAFRRVYVLPVYVERVIYFDLFRNSETIHRESLDKAQRFLKRVKNHASRFEMLAKKEGAAVARVSDKEVPGGWGSLLMPQVHAGMVFPQVVSTEENWGVAFRSSAKKELRVALFRKRNFDEWVNEERAIIGNQNKAQIP